MRCVSDGLLVVTLCENAKLWCGVMRDLTVWTPVNADINSVLKYDTLPTSLLATLDRYRQHDPSMYSKRYYFFACLPAALSFEAELFSRWLHNGFLPQRVMDKVLCLVCWFSCSSFLL